MKTIERILRTFEGKEIDRIATYDIMHNVNLMEYLTKKKITKKNAEDVACQAVSKVLDIVRHFSIPYDLEPKIEKDEDGFVYKKEWWTVQVLKRPFSTIKDAARIMHKDIERIHDCISKGKVCKQALFPVRLFGEDYEYFEEIKQNFKRCVEKMNGTQMIAPESCTLYIALERFDIMWWTYLYKDYPDLVINHLDALTDYELARIDSFADTNITPISFTSDPIGTNDSLMFSPDFVFNVLLPRTKKLIERWKSHGYKHIYFADGFKWPILDEILSWGLIDAVDPFEPLAHMEVSRFRKEYPNTTICQPIDCQNLLFTGTPEEVRRATLKSIKDANGKKILIGSSSEVHPNIPIENAMAMYEAARSYKL
ncbi:MAG: hypothetical protein M1479_10105 [Actinobacteria bacterium]|nr:hypothetical protein [Actinomycetota bacterium]